MKRILFFLGLVSLGIGCNKCPECPKCPPNNASTSMSDPTDTIVADYSKVDQDWIENNRNHIIGVTPNGNFYIGLSLINENAQHTVQSGWLADNGDKIHFGESNKYIVGIHKLPPNTYLSLPQNAPQLTYGEIKDKINRLENNTSYFEDGKYNKFVVISINNNNEVDLNLTAQYNYIGDCYSIPFLRALESEVPDVTNQTIFRFGHYESNNNRQAIFFKVGEYNRYFNISNKPPFLPKAERKS